MGRHLNSGEGQAHWKGEQGGHNLFGQSIQTSMRNLESLAQKMSVLCSI